MVGVQVTALTPFFAQPAAVGAESVKSAVCCLVTVNVLDAPTVALADSGDIEIETSPGYRGVPSIFIYLWVMVTFICPFDVAIVIDAVRLAILSFGWRIVTFIVLLPDGPFVAAALRTSYCSNGSSVG